MNIFLVLSALYCIASYIVSDINVLLQASLLLVGLGCFFKALSES